MRRLTRFLVPSVLVLVMAHAAPAESSPFGKGAVEINPTLAFSHDSYSSNGTSDLTTSTLAFSGLVGYFVTDVVELGGELLVTHQSLSVPGFSGSASATSAGLAGTVTLNFATAGNVVPFLRGGVGFLSNSGNGAVGTNTTVIAPLLEGGMRAMVGNSASVNFGVGYQHHSSALGVQDESANVITVQIGVSAFPKLRK